MFKKSFLVVIFVALMFVLNDSFDFDSNMLATIKDKFEKPEKPPPVVHTLFITKDGAGDGTVSSPPGINCGPNCKKSFNEGTVVTFIATPKNGSTFIGWSGDVDCLDGTVIMDSDKNCIATFNVVIVIDGDSKIKIKLDIEERQNRSITLELKIKDRESGKEIKVFENLISNLDGAIEIDAPDLPEAMYTARIAVLNFLPVEIKDAFLPNDETQFISPRLLAGNLFDLDNTINELDAGVLNRNWGSADQNSDINQDGIVNEIDWEYIKTNWGKSGL